MSPVRILDEDGTDVTDSQPPEVVAFLEVLCSKKLTLASLCSLRRVLDHEINNRIRRLYVVHAPATPHHPMEM